MTGTTPWQAGTCLQKQQVHWPHCLCNQAAERTGSGASLQNPKILPQSHSSSNKSSPLKGSLTFPNSATSWGPNIQTHELIEDISHSNQKTFPPQHHALLGHQTLVCSQLCTIDWAVWAGQPVIEQDTASIVRRGTAKLCSPGCSGNQVSPQNSGYIAGSGLASSSSSEHLSVCFQRLSLTLNSVCLLHVWSTVSKT